MSEEMLAAAEIEDFYNRSQNEDSHNEKPIQTVPKPYKRPQQPQSIDNGPLFSTIERS